MIKKIYNKLACKVNALHTDCLMQTLSYDPDLHPGKGTEVLVRGRRGT